MSFVTAFNHVLRVPGGRILHDQISFRVEPGDRLGITGPSGCGKSTLLRQIAIEATKDASHEASLRVDVQNCDFLPQGDFLFPWFTPKQNYNAWLGVKLNQSVRSADLQLAETLSIDGMLDRRFSALSGGERQRVALWTSLSRKNDLLIIDEPFTALDMERKATCLEALSSALNDRLKALIFVSHDYDTLTYLSNRILLFGSSPETPIQIFEFPGKPPSSRQEYLDRRESNCYSELLKALTGV